MILRPATPEDAPALARILGDWVRETGWMPLLHSRAADEGFLRGLIYDAEVTVAEEAAPLGFLARTGEVVTALHLAPAARGRGIGRALLDHAKGRCARLVLYTFQANPRAVAFYQREGFRIVGRSDGSLNAEGLPDLRLEWEAAP